MMAVMRHEASKLSVGRALRPTRRRILPVFLPAVGSHIEEAEVDDDRLDAAAGRKVRVVDLFAVAQKAAQSGHLIARLRGDAEILVEGVASRGHPGEIPAHLV